MRVLVLSCILGIGSIVFTRLNEMKTVFLLIFNCLSGFVVLL